MVVSVRLLGAPAVSLEDGWLELPPGKLSALLLYLACQDGWVSRDDLLYLFWPDSAERGARQNLRALLSKLRRLAYVKGLEVEPSRLRWPVETDLQAFRRACAERRWARAAELYGSDFLRGFALSGALEFENWLELERKDLKESWREALLNLAAALEADARSSQAAELLARLHHADSLDEVVFRHYLLALHRSGERHKALVAMASFRGSLQTELGLEPEEATLRLGERIKAGQPLEPAREKAPLREHRCLPQPPATPFVGRDREKAALNRRFTDPACCLVSLVGPGGIGKTRLALELAAEHQNAFADGVCFVALEDVGEVDAMVLALAGALGVSLHHSRDSREQLLDFLRDKALLLVLDNLEHLLEGIGFIAELLAAAPELKVLATSRECLNLRAEWVFDLAGLEYPAKLSPRDKPRELQRYDSVRLFAQAARRARGELTLPGEFQAAARIASLVEGMPLALELAASWLRMLTADEVAAELEKGMDLLAAPSRDRPDRHRSVHAVFEQTWSLLQPREREALRKLAAFRGGFRREAAAAVAGVGLPLLLALVNKSVLRRNAAGRFSRHPLVSQFIRPRAAAHPEERAQAEERHSDFFLDFLGARGRDLHTARGRAALDEVEADLENIEAAWRWAAEHGREDWLRRAAPSLNWFYFSRSWLERRLRVMRFAHSRVQASGVVAGQLLSHIGASLGHQACFEESVAALEQGLRILDRHGAKAELAYHLRVLGTMYHRLGPAWYPNYLASCGRALRLYRELGDVEGTTMMLHSLAYHAKDIAESERLFAEGIRLSRGAGLSRPLAMTLDSVAELYCYRKGDYPAASKAMDECLARFAEAGELFYRLLALGSHARVLVAAGDYDAAAGQAHELLELSAGLEPRVATQMEGEARSLLARLARLRGQGREAGILAETSLLARRGSEALETLARLALAKGRLVEAATWLNELWTKLEPQPMRGSFRLVAARLSCQGLWAELAALRGDERQAAQRFREALKLAYEWSYLPAALELLVGVATLLERRGAGARAAELLALAAGHPASARMTKDAATRALKRRTMTLPKTGADERVDVRGVVAGLLEALA